MTINILFVAAEAEPFVKVGGLGDVAGALPRAIQKVSEENNELGIVDIRVVLPFHYAIKEKNFDITFLGEFQVDRQGEAIACQVYQYDQGTIPVYLLDGKPVNGNSPVYSLDPFDDGEKYIFFSLASLKLAEFLDWRVDILQANDWHTAFAIYALNILPKPSHHLSKTKTIHTLHNLPFMGYGVQEMMTEYGLPPTSNPVLPEWAQHTPLPLGLLFADKIVAVSPHYAQEILTPEFGCGLEDFLKTREDAITGIINGLDTEVWNPEKDPFIAHNYSSKTLSEREINKQYLQEKYNLPQHENVPLITLVSRMDPQKGIDIALTGLTYCKDEPWQAIILGTGTPDVENMARQLEKEFPNRVRSIIDFDNKLAHQLYAGADIFMMPSRYEPCGLSQMISMRYGCVPLARATGGLVDTVKHVSRTIDGGTGFLFANPYPSTFAKTLKRAIRLYYKPDDWQNIQLNGMKIDFSWENSAHKYIDLYQNLTKNAGGIKKEKK